MPRPGRSAKTRRDTLLAARFPPRWPATLCALALALPLWLLSPAALSAEEAVTCTVAADSVLHRGRFAPARLLDGERKDPESRWASSRAPGPHWVAFRFARAVRVDRVVVHGHAQPDLALADAEVQVEDGGRWRTVASVRANAKAVVELGFAEVRAEALRLHVTRACRRDSTVRLFEVEFYRRGQRIRVVAASRRAGPKRRLSP